MSIGYIIMSIILVAVSTMFGFVMGEKRAYDEVMGFVDEAIKNLKSRRAKEIKGEGKNGEFE